MYSSVFFWFLKSFILILSRWERTVTRWACWVSHRDTKFKSLLRVSSKHNCLSFLKFNHCIRVKSGLLGRRRSSADLLSVHLSMWTTDQKLGSDRPSHGQIRTLDQDYSFEMDEWTDFCDGFLTDGRKSVRGRLGETMVRVSFLLGWIKDTSTRTSSKV